MDWEKVGGSIELCKGKWRRDGPDRPMTSGMDFLPDDPPGAVALPLSDITGR